jgi:hypothetical protein
VAVFTLESTVLQVYLNNEPIFSYRPTNDQLLNNKSNTTNIQAGLPSNNNTNSRSSQQPHSQYQLERFRHSIGEVTCLSIEEVVSLPPEAILSFRYYSPQLAQGFLAIQKI